MVLIQVCCYFHVPVSLELVFKDLLLHLERMVRMCVYA
jgi:hypothetical protein